MKKLCTAIMCFASMSLLASNALADKYRVYCANGKIEVDTRDIKQMKSARGTHTRQLAEFNYRTEAVNYAKKFGGVGASCKK